MLNMNELIGFGAGPGLLAVAYQGRSESGSALSSYTFSGMPIGTPDGSRLVVAAVGYYDNSGATTDISSVSIGGVSATRVNGANQYIVGNYMVGVALWVAAVPAGTTADVIVALTETVANCHVATWSIINASSSAAANSIASSFGATTATLPLSLNVDAGSVVIGYALDITNAGTFTWAGLTENFDFATGANTHSGASALPTTSGTPMTITATRTGGSNGAAGVVGVWK